MNLIKIIKFDFLNIIRNPTLLIVNTIFPLVIIGVMGFITKGGFGALNINSYDYYGVTLMIFTAIMLAMTASNTFMEDKVKKGNTRIIYAPVSKTEIYLSKLISTYLLGTIAFSILIFFQQYILHINLGGKNILYIVVLINILSFLGACLGTMFCSIFKNEQLANSIMQIPILIFVLLGGSFFSIEGHGKLIANLSVLSPVKWITECAFKIIYDDDFSIYMPTIGIILAFSIICIILCQITFKPEEYV
jgi:ABC-type multidrug transport system, permease component